jgi:glucosamine-6-phosphate deaminase
MSGVAFKDFIGTEYLETMSSIQALETFKVDQLNVQVYHNRKTLGLAAGEQAIQQIIALLAKQEQVRIVFAAAPSQNEFLQALACAEGIDWSRIAVFHMDEYIGLPDHLPQRFGRFLCDRLFDQVKPAIVHLIDGNENIQEECVRYASLLREKPIDLVFLGIGENGHIAFNDPPVADFNDSVWCKAVELEIACRLQQVNDGCFPDLASVPTHAVTLTIPALLSGTRLFCMVPGLTKQLAVMHTLNSPINTDCPATILRTHSDCTLYVDEDSYGIEK